MYVCVLGTWSYLTLCNPMDCSPTRLLCPWDSPDKNIWVDCIPFSRGFSWPRDQTLGLLYCRQIPYRLSYREVIKVAQSCLSLCSPMDCTIHEILQARILGWVAILSSRGSSQPGIEPRSPTLQADSLAAEPQGKPKNTGVGSLSLLQGIFPTQESNQGLLHCRWILYQLGDQGSPVYIFIIYNRIRHTIYIIYNKVH